MPLSTTLRAVVFDLDGLLFNTEELYQDVGGELLRRRGKRFEADLFNAMMGRPPRVSLQIMIDWHGLDATVEQLAAETERCIRRDSRSAAGDDARGRPLLALWKRLAFQRRLPRAADRAS